MRVVATYGVFDMFHEGHVNLLKRAREMGDYLIVGVTTNHFDELRGKLNTTDSFEVRRQAIEASGLADEVIPETYRGQKEDDIRNRGIDVIVFGSDWTGHFDYLADLCEVVYLPRTEGISSSALRDARFPNVRIGIMGTGRIARRFITEAACIGGKQLIGVYNVNGAHAQSFAEETGLSFASGDIDEFFDAVDAVYIASPHQHHHEQTKMALSAGKHVLCEKPLALSRAEAQEVFDIAEQQNLVLLEAVKTAYCPGFTELIDVVESGTIGEVRDVEAAFTRLTAPGVRERDDETYGGSFLEFGSYGLLAAVRLLGAQRVMQMETQFYTQRDGDGVDLFTKASLHDSDASVLVKTGLGVKTEGQLLISGTLGYILVSAPWWLTSHFEVHREDPTDIRAFDLPFLGMGLRYEISNFVHLIRHDEDRYPKLSTEESIAMASIYERYLEARGRTC